MTLMRETSTPWSPPYTLVTMWPQATIPTVIEAAVAAMPLTLTGT